MKKLIFAFLIAATTPLTAFAWKAMSVNYWPMPRIYISHEMPTLEEARAEALSRCQTAAVSTMTGPENCRPYGSAISGETAVVVHGENGLIWASSNEPKEALSRAMANCKKVSTTCVPFAATHSSHVRFTGIAFSQTHGFFAYTREVTQERANEKVLSMCEKRTNAKCDLKKMGMMELQISYAVAVSEDGVNHTIQRGETPERAQRQAILTCEAENKKTCVAANYFNPVSNVWEGGLNKAQLADLSEIQRTAQLNVERLREQHFRSTRAEHPNVRSQPQARQSAPKRDMGPCIETRVYKGHEADVIRTPGCN